MSVATPMSWPGSSPTREELSLCFDPESDLIGEFDEGLPLFDGDKPTENLNGILKFCEDFEVAGAAHLTRSSRNCRISTC